VFLDEIGDMSLPLQAKLLRVIEDQVIRPVGSTKGTKIDIRLITATNRDLRAAVRANAFREDLYYRINVLPVKLPSLAERLEELPQWASYMLGRCHRERGVQSAARIGPDAVALLSGVPWPGNLRQLDNIVRRAYALAVAERSGSGGELVLERRHVERALAYEDAPETVALLSQLWRAARAFVQEAERHKRSGEPLTLDLADAFRGMVLGAAVLRLGSRDEAFVLLRQEQLLRNRNQHRTLRRELDRVRELVRVLGGEIDRDLAGLLEEPEEPPQEG
jgi:transcriptional regulator with GAF, ATPase, and Fis domain